MVGISGNRLIEIVIILEIFIYFIYKEKIALPKFNYSIIVYFLLSFLSLIFIFLKPDIQFSEIKHLSHFLLYAFLNVTHYYILSSQKIISLKPLKVVLIICSILAIIFSINSLLITYSGINELLQDSPSSSQIGFLSLEHQLKEESTSLFNALVYLGNTNGRSINLLFILSATTEILLKGKVIIMPIRLVTALFCGSYSFLSVSRGATLLSTIYFLYALFELISFIKKNKNSEFQIINYKYIYSIGIIFLFLFSFILFLIINETSQSLQMGSYFFTDKITSNPLSNRFDLLEFTIDKLLQNPITMFFGNGYMYMEYLTKRIGGGIGQITWLEIASSSGIVAAISYIIFLYQTLLRCLKNINKRLSGYQNIFKLIFINIILIGFTVHYLDKLPTILLVYFTLCGWFYAHNKTLNKYDKEEFINY